MMPPTSVKQSCAKVAGKKTREVALHLFLQQHMTVAEIAETMLIAESTVLNYLGKASREADEYTLKHLASRLGLVDTLLRRGIQQKLASYVSGTSSSTQESVDYAEFYQQVISQCIQLHPDAKKVDWRIVRETFSPTQDPVPIAAYAWAISQYHKK